MIVPGGGAFRSVCCIAEQPVLVSYRKRTDDVFGAVVVDRHAAVVKECEKVFLLVQSITHRFGKLAPSADMKRFKPRKELVKQSLYLHKTLFVSFFHGNICQQTFFMVDLVSVLDRFAATDVLWADLSLGNASTKRILRCPAAALLRSCHSVVAVEIASRQITCEAVQKIGGVFSFRSRTSCYTVDIAVVIFDDIFFLQYTLVQPTL